MEERDFENELKEKTGKVQNIILRFLPDPEHAGKASRICDAMRYSMEAGGKRIRPLFMYETYRLFGGTSAVVEPFMAAIEMIHTHSLIHDDLPAIDNDSLRRGKPTTHAVYGEAMGVLAGDALLNYAYETALQAFFYGSGLRGTKPDFGESMPERIVFALKILAESTGFRGMLGGQSVDVENEKSNRMKIDRETLDYIYEHKTSRLIEAPLQIGAVLAGAGKSEILCMKDIGSRIGLAFQIRDDILDVTADEKDLGKPVFSDEKNEKTTYVTLFGIDGAEDRVRMLTDQAVDLLETLPGDSSFLIWLTQRMAERRK